MTTATGRNAPPPVRMASAAIAATPVMSSPSTATTRSASDGPAGQAVGEAEPAASSTRKVAVITPAPPRRRRGLGPVEGGHGLSSRRPDGEVLHAPDLVPDGLDVVEVQHVDVEHGRVAVDLDGHRAGRERGDVGHEGEQAVGDRLLQRHGDDARRMRSRRVTTSRASATLATHQLARK